MPQYHSRTFDLIGIEPRASKRSKETLAQREKDLGRMFPSAVREWYELEDACELLHRYSNYDRPLDISELGSPATSVNVEDPHNLLAQGLLTFKWENQGVCVWAIYLDGSEDPPVVVDVETQFRSWSRCADSFSDHVYSCAWDYGFVLNGDLMVQAQNRALSQDALAFLNQHFQPEVVTYGWPGHTQYRFFNGSQRLLIWSNYKQADWHLVADNLEEFEALLRTLGPIDSLAEAFWSHSEQGQAALKKMRS